MRPQKLNVSAFGPFAGEVEVDFSAFTGNELFLIEGPTGVGKTSLLDAMCFALYGEVPGARNETGVTLRSVHAAADVRTELCFQFALGEQTYRVTRTPVQERPKKRGSGTVTDAPTAQLDRLEGGTWTPWITNVKEVRGRVEELLGLSCEQFKQVLLMPQGEFREFLVAGSDKKEALLEKLFGTSAYGEVTQELAERRNRLAKAGSDARKRREGVLEGAGVESVEALRAQRDALAERAPELALAVENAQVRLLAARQSHDEARALHVAAAAFTEAHREQQRLEARRPELAGWRQELELASRAEPVLRAAAQFQRLEEDARQRERLLTGARERRDAALALRAQRREDAARLPELEATLKDSRARLHQLSELVALEVQRTSLRREQEAAAGQLEAARRELTEAEAQARALETQAAAASETLHGLEDAAGQAAEARLRVERLQEQVGKREELEAARKAFRSAEAACRASQERQDALQRRLEAALTHLEAGRHAREAGLAAELAQGLAPGQPCPVCGGRDHPAPASGDGSQVTREEVARREADVDQARRTLESAQTALAAARETLAEIRSRGAALRETLGGGAEESLEAWAARLVEARDVLVAADATVARGRELQAQLEVLIRKREQAREAVTTAKVQLERAARAHEHLSKDLRARDEELARKLPGGGRAADQLEAEQQREASLDAERLRLQRDLQAAEVEARGAEEQVRGLEHEQEGRTSELEAARAAVEQELATHHFDSVEQARRHARSEPERTRRMQEVESLESELERIAGRVAATREALGGADPEALPDLVPLQATLAGADDAVEALKKEQAEATVQLSALETSLAAIAALDAEFGRADAELRVVGRLADVMAGRNDRRMNLQRFVLASRMDEVALMASERLLRMSRGRYALIRTDDVRHRGRNSGLDLMVRDHEVGQDRYVQSLSGGEMFLASLSLALGLAEVVSRRRGAIRMDALFIDEGFGTLDDETLDLVMRTLEDLRLGGRLVGIISHVSELKQRIPSRISVRRSAGGGGSSVRVVA